MTTYSYAPLDVGAVKANVPLPLQELPVWVLWKLKTNGTDKPKKIPHYAESGKARGKSDTPVDREQLVTLDKALAHFDLKRHAGVGVALGRIHGTPYHLSGIDLDHAVQGTKIGNAAQHIVAESQGTYVEFSPSGTGLKLFGLGDIGTEDQENVEIYSGARYFTVTGRHISGKELKDLTRAAAKAREVIQLRIKHKAASDSGSAATATESTSQSSRFGSKGRNTTLSREAYRLKREGMSDDGVAGVIHAMNRALPDPLPDNEIDNLLRGKRKVQPNEVPKEYGGVDPRIVEELQELPENLLVLPNDYLPYTVAAERIFKHMGRKHELFMRGISVVELHEQALVAIDAADLQSRIDAKGRKVQAYVSSGRDDNRLYLKEKRCSMNVASVLLASREAREYLPPIELVTQSPILVEHEGALVTLDHGYHAEGGGVLVLGKGTVPDVPLETAVTDLLGLLKEFRFNEEGDRSRAVANTIGPCLRMGRLLKGFHLINATEADQSQTGKGYLHRIQRAIYNESVQNITDRKGGVGSFDESLSHALLSGQPFIAFDNLRGKLDSPYLEMILTSADPVAARVPHRGTVSVDVQRVVFQLTSNGIESTPDLANRSLITRLLKRPNHKFEHDPLTSIEENQLYYLGCVFSVVRAWHAAGKIINPTSHTFRQWVGALDWIVQNVFKLPPLLEGHSNAVARISNPALAWLRKVAIEVVGSANKGRELSASRVAEVSNDAGIEIPNCATGDEARSAQAVGRHMKRCFDNSTEVIIDSYRVERVIRQVRIEREQRYKDWPMYVFTRVGETAVAVQSSSMNGETVAAYSIPMSGDQELENNGS